MHHPTKLPGYAHSPMTARQPPPERSLLQATRLITYQPGMVRLESPEPSSPVEKYRKSASHNIGKLPPFRGGEGQHLSKIGGSPPLGGGSHSCLLVKQPAFPPSFCLRSHAHTLAWPDQLLRLAPSAAAHQADSTHHVHGAPTVSRPVQRRGPAGGEAEDLRPSPRRGRSAELG